MSESLDFQPDEQQDINAFAPTNPQNQAPGSTGTPLSPIVKLPKMPGQQQAQPQASPPPQAQAPAPPAAGTQTVEYKPSLDLQPDTSTPVDTSAMKDYINKNLEAYQQTDEFKNRNPTQNEAKTLWDALKAGWQNSSLGLAWRDKMPDTSMPKDPSFAMGLMNQAGSLAGDFPAMVAGGAFGAGVGAGLGGLEGSVVPVAGTAAGAVTEGTMGAMGGAFAAPKAIRKI